MALEEREQAVRRALARPEVHVADPNGPAPHVVHPRTVWIVSRAPRPLRRGYQTMAAACRRYDIRPLTVGELNEPTRLFPSTRPSIPSMLPARLRPPPQRLGQDPSAPH